MAAAVGDAGEIRVDRLSSWSPGAASIWRTPHSSQKPAASIDSGPAPHRQAATGASATAFSFTPQRPQKLASGTVSEPQERQFGMARSPSSEQRARTRLIGAIDQSDERSRIGRETGGAAQLFFGAEPEISRIGGAAEQRRRPIGGGPVGLLRGLQQKIRRQEGANPRCRARAPRESPPPAAVRRGRAAARPCPARRKSARARSPSAPRRRARSSRESAPAPARRRSDPRRRVRPAKATAREAERRRGVGRVRLADAIIDRLGRGGFAERLQRQSQRHLRGRLAGQFGADAGELFRGEVVIALQEGDPPLQEPGFPIVRIGLQQRRRSRAPCGIRPGLTARSSSA